MRKYDSYKPTKIEFLDEIPEHWEEKRMRFLGYLYGGLSGKSATDFNQLTNEDNKYFIPFTNIANNFRIDPESLQTVVISENENQNSVQKGDLFFLMSSENYDDVGKSAVLLDDLGETYLNSFCKGFRITKEKIVPEFLNYQLHSKQLRHNLLTGANGFTRINLKIDKVIDLLTALPTPEEQTAIAAYLDRKTAEIDELIADKKRLLELYEEEKTAIINQAVTKGTNPDVPLKDSGIEWLGEIPEHWEVKRFDYLFSFSRGLSITKADLRDSGIPCVSYGEIHSKYGFEVNPNHHSLKCVDEEYLNTNEKSLLRYGDFVFADTSEDIEGSGNFTYLNSNVPTFAGYHTIIGKPLIDFERRYVAYFFNTLSFRNQIRSKVTGTKVYSITQAILKFTNIVVPPISEQREIVDFIDNACSVIDSKKTKTEKLIELLTEYRTALISEVVTGKINIIE